MTLDPRTLQCNPLGARFVTAGIEWDFALIDVRRRVSALRSLQL